MSAIAQPQKKEEASFSPDALYRLTVEQLLQQWHLVDYIPTPRSSNPLFYSLTTPVLHPSVIEIHSCNPNKTQSLGF